MDNFRFKLSSGLKFSTVRYSVQFYSTSPQWTPPSIAFLGPGTIFFFTMPKKVISWRGVFLLDIWLLSKIKAGHLWKMWGDRHKQESAAAPSIFRPKMDWVAIINFFYRVTKFSSGYVASCSEVLFYSLLLDTILEWDSVIRLGRNEIILLASAADVLHLPKCKKKFERVILQLCSCYMSILVILRYYL